MKHYLLLPLLWLLARLFSMIVGIRNSLYDFGLLRARSLGRPVVSVGNLTVGGSGKTPLVLHLIQILSARGIRCAVVSRGYGRASTGPKRVSPQLDGAARIFGDEPVLIARTFPNVPVLVSACRIQAKELLPENTDLVIADDAFQHRSLTRAYDLVAVDATAPLESWRPLPLGRMREDWSALKRARAVVLTRCNLTDELQLEFLHQHVRRAAPNIPVIALDARVQRVSQAPVFAFSGVANNEQFRRVLLDSSTDLRLFRGFDDHHRYTNSECVEMARAALQAGAQIALTTEKDGVKLHGLWPQDLLPLHSVTLELVPATERDQQLLETLHVELAHLVFRKGL